MLIFLKEGRRLIEEDILENNDLCSEPEPSYIAGGNIKWYSQFGKQFGGSSKRWAELPCDPALLLVGVYPGNSKHMSTQKRVHKCSGQQYS